MRNKINPAIFASFSSIRGFTLVELLVNVTIGSVLTALTIPAMTGMLNTQKITSSTNTLFFGLHLARNEAIKRNARAVLCKSSTGLSCAMGGGWDQGWIVFHDANNNALLDAGEDVVQQQGPAASGIRLRGNLPVNNYVSFTSTGSAKLTSGAFQAGTFTLCMDSTGGANVRQIVLAGTGRMRTQKGTSSDCS